MTEVWEVCLAITIWTLIILGLYGLVVRPTGEKMKLNADTSLNPEAPKYCFLDIDGVVVDNKEPFKVRDGVLQKVKKLTDDGWVIIAFTSRTLQSLEPLVAQGLPIYGYIPKPVGREIMVIDDVLSEARNQL